MLDILTDAVAPTNTLIGNPLALKKAYDTRGRSLVKGMRNLYSDWMTNGGMSLVVPDTPLNRANRPMRTNW